MGLALLAAFPARPGAAESRDASLATIREGAAERRLLARPPGEGPAAVLAAAAGLDSFPASCATPLLLEFKAGEGTPEALRQACATVAARPTFVDERTIVTRDGRFVVHYPGPGGADGPVGGDRNHNGVPDLVDRVSESLTAARSAIVSSMGFPEPAPASPPLDVFVARLGFGLEGLTVPAREPEAGAAFVLLDAGIPSDRVLDAVLHQVAHASLMTMAPRGTSTWWAEASASFLTVAAGGDLEGYAAAIRSRQQSPGRALTSDGLLLMQGSLLWPMFLAERLGDPGAIRQIWEDMSAQGIDALAATDRVLRRSAGLSLQDAFREEAAWDLFTGSRDDGRHYRIGTALPEATLATLGPALPFSLAPVEPIEPLGSVAFRIPSDNREGSLRLEILADGGRPAADILVTYRASGDRPVLVTVPIDERGTGTVALPWKDAREAWLILRNAASEPGSAPARFEVRGSHDPFAPYDLAAFTTQVVGPTIVLEWTTASEEGLVSWNVYRADAPSGPFVRLNGVALPAYGDATAETGYVYVDERPVRGTRHYYLLEGITRAGLVQRSHFVSGRIPPGR